MPIRRWVFSVVLLIGAAGAAAQDTDCRFEIENEEIRGNLNVAVACEVSDVEIRGNVTIFAGGSLTARDARFEGNLDAYRADFVDIEGGRIDGNVQLDELVGDRSRIEGAEVSGNISLTNNRSRLELLDNELGGNVRVSGNAGGIVISGNDIDGNLQCSGNDPAPLGEANRARRASGQCEQLQAAVSQPPTDTGVLPPASRPPLVVIPSIIPPLPIVPPLPPVTPPAPAEPDVIPPTLRLLGEATVSILIDSPYADAGATATDNVDGDLTSRIVAVSNVDTKTLGIYAVTYNVSDLSGNAARSVSRTVNVTPPSTVQESSGGGGALGIELAAVLLIAAWRARQK